MPANFYTQTLASLAAFPPANYVDPVDRKSWLSIYAGCLYGASTLLLALRVMVRFWKRGGGWGIDDILVIVGWMAATFFTALLVVGANMFNLGRHTWDVPQKSAAGVALIGWIAEFSFIMCSALIKVSVLLFYRRLLHDSFGRPWKIAIRLAIGFIVAYTTAFAFVVIFNCSPTNAYWKSFDPTYDRSYTCVDTRALNTLIGVCTCFSDLYSVILPCALVATYGLERKAQIFVSLMFCSGLMVVAASAVRTKWFYDVAYEPDTIWVLCNTIVWAQLELQLGLICACIPSLRVLFHREDPSPSADTSATSHEPPKKPRRELRRISSITVGLSWPRGKWRPSLVHTDSNGAVPEVDTIVDARLIEATEARMKSGTSTGSSSTEEPMTPGVGPETPPHKASITWNNPVYELADSRVDLEKQ